MTKNTYNGSGLWSTEDGMVRARSLAEINLTVSSAGIPRSEGLPCDRIPAPVSLRTGVGVADAACDVGRTSSYEAGVGYKDDSKGEAWKWRRKKDTPQEFPVLRLRGGGGGLDGNSSMPDNNQRKHDDGEDDDDDGMDLGVSKYVPAWNGSFNPGQGKFRPYTDNGRQKLKRKTFDTANIAGSMFAGASAAIYYYVIIQHREESATTDSGGTSANESGVKQDKFADLNYIERLNAVKAALKIPANGTGSLKSIVMKKFKRRDETSYKVEVRVEDSKDMSTLLPLTEMAGCPIKVTENINKNTVKGIVIDFDEELKGLSNQQLLKAADHPGLREVYRYGDSKVYKVSFSGQEKPLNLTFWKELSFKVKKYYDPPTRCYKCQQYGHMSRSCRNSYACDKCALIYDEVNQHTPKECTLDMKCVNCAGAHKAGSRDCEEHKLQKKWSEISQDQNIKVVEAKRKYPEGKVPTFASAVQSANFTAARFPNTIRTKPVPVVESDQREEKDKDQEDKDKELQDWRKQQETLMKQMQARLTAQETESAKAKVELEQQGTLIKKLQEEVSRKDDQIKVLTEENERLLVKIDQMSVNANKVLAEDVKRLKAQLQEKEEELKRQKTGKAPGKLKPSGGSPG